MKHSVNAIERRRRQILADMESIRSLECATLKDQMIPVHHKGKREPVLRGPYYVLARWENGRTKSRRVKAGELERVKADVANHKRFLALCREYEELTERLGQLEREQDAQAEALKKKLKPRSRKTKKPAG